MTGYPTTAALVLLGLPALLLSGCAGRIAERERADLLKQWQRLAFKPLLAVIEEGELRRVILEMGPREPPERMTVVDSEDPEVLRLVREGLVAAERPVEVRSMAVGIGAQGRAIVYSKTLCADIWLTRLGFSVGSYSPADYTCFVSPGLAAALGGLYSRKTGAQMDAVLLRGLTERSSEWFPPDAVQGWERIWRPRD